MVSWLDPHVDRYVLSTAGEDKVVEVKKHWAASAWPAVRLAIGLVIFISAFAYQSPVYWVFIIVGGALAGQALWRILEEFRVHGVLSVARASIPLVRILDITVNKSVIGRWLNYGHFVFESAAQVQGLNVIRYVKDIDQREDVLRMVMAGDLPQPIVAVEEDDGT
jgi:Bacterial PH domain